MSARSENKRCEQAQLVACYALAMLDGSEADSMAAHLAVCSECQREYDLVGGLTSALSAWRDQDLPRPAPLWDSLLQRISKVPQKGAPAAVAPGAAFAPDWSEPQWQQAAPGITCKLLSTDEQQKVTSMLVRLAPGISYPPHRHAGVEEMFLLEGELWIEDRKLLPGDFNRAAPGTSDQRVYSETGCMCLLITSSLDELR
ncbi:MAG TPA: cupin domain-containing protein [Steroidobacter sp.]|uniref:cupin domain-containing protein n=1 Tax=Steroidobacter sp. TaxID=1978227 RepID=UPI002EDAE8AA